MLVLMLLLVAVLLERNSIVGVGSVELLGVGAEVVTVGGGGVNVLTGDIGGAGTHCGYRWHYCYW